MASTIEHASEPQLPDHMVVVGAAAGPGRWIVDRVLATTSWQRLTLVDTKDAVRSIDTSGFAAEHVQLAVTVDDDERQCFAAVDGDSPVKLDGPNTAILIATPGDARRSLLAWLPDSLAGDAVIGIVAGTMRAAREDVVPRWPAASCFGIHALVDSAARTAAGQTVLVSDADGNTTHEWFGDLVTEAGGISRVVDPDEHDDVMSYVQTMTHQTLLTFGRAVTGYEGDLDRLWELRTPLFEALFGLSARVLGQSRETTMADVQRTLDGDRIARELDRAIAESAAAVDDDAAGVAELIRGTRDRFSGALFETVQATASVALEAAQSKRAELARRLGTNQLVGLRVGGQAALRVGEIVEVTPTTVSLREVLAGERGEAALLHGAGLGNAKKLGINGKPRDTTFALGNIELITGDDLDRELDNWIGSLDRDVRFLVPESVSGEGVLSTVSEQQGVRNASLVSEVVRTGQRAVVVRASIRADYDLDPKIDSLRAQVQRTYAWPRGLSLSTGPVRQISFLGPRGTFSEIAARQARESTGLDDAELTPCSGFPGVLASVGDGAIGVLPVSSSASGLVDRSIDAVLAHPEPLVAGGVVDVAVRFDAYARPEFDAKSVRGVVVYSHPQALAQCSGFIKRWQLEPVPTDSTAEALDRVAASTEPCVALAGSPQHDERGLHVLSRDVDDLSGSITRFLVVGGADTFGELGGGSLPTLRSIWIASSLSAVAGTISGLAGSAFDEFLTSESGACLWITSRLDVDVDDPNLRFLGRAPWTPRSPIVRVERS